MYLETGHPKQVEGVTAVLEYVGDFKSKVGDKVALNCEVAGEVFGEPLLLHCIQERT